MNLIPQGSGSASMPWFDLVEDNKNYTSMAVMVFGIGMCVVTRPCDHFYAISLQDVKITMKGPQDIIFEPLTLAFSLRRELRMRSMHPVWLGKEDQAMIERRGHILMQARIGIGFDIKELGSVTVDLTGGILIDADTNAAEGWGSWELEETLRTVNGLNSSGATGNPSPSGSLGVGIMANAEVAPKLRIGPYDLNLREIMRGSGVFEAWSDKTQPFRLVASLRIAATNPLHILDTVVNQNWALVVVKWYLGMFIGLLSPKLQLAAQLDMFAKTDVMTGPLGPLQSSFGVRINFEGQLSSSSNASFGLALQTYGGDTFVNLLWNGRLLRHTGPRKKDKDCPDPTAFYCVDVAALAPLGTEKEPQPLCVECREDKHCNHGSSKVYPQYCESPDSKAYEPHFVDHLLLDYIDPNNPEYSEENRSIKIPTEFSFTCVDFPLSKNGRMKVDEVVRRNKDQQCAQKIFFGGSSRRRAQETGDSSANQPLEEWIQEVPSCYEPFVVVREGDLIEVGFILILTTQRDAEFVSQFVVEALRARVSELAGGAPANVEVDNMPSGLVGVQVRVVHTYNSTAGMPYNDQPLQLLADAVAQNSTLRQDIEETFGPVQVVRTH